MRIWVIWLIAVIAPCLPAEAGDVTKFVLNGWMASSFKDLSSGRFSHCAAFASFEGGTSAVISVDRNYAWSLGFGISSWRFEHKTIPLTYRFDSGPWQDGGGAVKNSRFVALIPPARITLIELLKHRHVMEAELDGESIYIRFYDSDELISRLASCYRQAAVALRPPQPSLCKKPIKVVSD